MPPLALLFQALDNNSFGALLAQRDTSGALRIGSCSSQTAVLLGKQSDLVGQTLRDAVSELDRDAWTELEQIARCGGGRLRAHRSDGGLLTIGIASEADTVCAIVELSDASLFAQLPAVAWMVDPALKLSRIQGSEPAAEAALALSVEQHDHHPPALEAHRRALRGEAGRFGFEHEGRSYEARVEPLVGLDGQIAGAAGLAVDVTERQRQEDERRRSQRMEAIGRLAGGVAHDFNNLLMIISACAEVIERKRANSESAHDELRAILDAVQRGQGLTRQLLTFAKQQVMRLERLDLSQVVRDFGDFAARLVGEDVVVELALADDPWPVMADAVQLQQILLNLSANARDAMPCGGGLRIGTENLEYSLHVDGPAVCLWVEDEGRGMSEEVRERAFEPFFSTKGELGTGLGLSTVRGIVSQLGGKIGVSSRLGKGTRFSIHFPRCPPESNH